MPSSSYFPPSKKISVIGSRIVLSTRFGYGPSTGQRDEREGTIKHIFATYNRTSVRCCLITAKMTLPNITRVYSFRGYQRDCGKSRKHTASIERLFQKGVGAQISGIPKGVLYDTPRSRLIKVSRATMFALFVAGH